MQEESKQDIINLGANDSNVANVAKNEGIFVILEENSGERESSLM